MRERGRDDAWHEDADDRDDARRMPERPDLDARYGRGDPRRNRWSGLDLAIGWGAAVLTIGLVGLLHGIALSIMSGGTSSPLLGVIIAPAAVLYGAPVVTVVGVPVAALAATLLRPVRLEWVHLVVFAALGAGGAALFAVCVGSLMGSDEASEWLVVTLPYGVVAAVAARVLAKRCAVRRFERERRRHAA